jgi:NAD(P)-dependent dehydrogenase (short-subunit alcohol dehydrogenase family)
MTVQIDLRGRRLLVVGGSAGIGRAAALSAAAAGAEIAVVGRSPEKIAGVIATAPRVRSLLVHHRDDAPPRRRCAGVGGLVELARRRLGEHAARLHVRRRLTGGAAPSMYRHTLSVL